MDRYAARFAAPERVTPNERATRILRPAARDRDANSYRYSALNLEALRGCSPRQSEGDWRPFLAESKCRSLRVAASASRGWPSRRPAASNISPNSGRYGAKRLDAPSITRRSPATDRCADILARQ